MPSQGFFIRHVKNLEMTNVEISTQKEDFRPAFVLNDVQGADFFRVKAPEATNVPVFALNNVSNFSVARSRPVPDTQLEHVDQRTL
jgi:hypothetical protein